MGTNQLGRLAQHSPFTYLVAVSLRQCVVFNLGRRVDSETPWRSSLLVADRDETGHQGSSRGLYKTTRVQCQ
jgi:hypothetical protein